MIDNEDIKRLDNIYARKDDCNNYYPFVCV